VRTMEFRARVPMARRGVGYRSAKGTEDLLLTCVIRRHEDGSLCRGVVWDTSPVRHLQDSRGM